MHQPRTNSSEESLFQMGALEIAAAIRAKTYSPRDVIDEFIKRVERINPKINAVVYRRFEEARKEAEVAEAELMRSSPEKLPPLLGVPFSVKEIIGLKGGPATIGAVYRKGKQHSFDASVVKRMRSAGAIPFVSTNVPEWAYWMETYNHVYGRTNNPHDLSRHPGGSSGGEASLVAAGASGFGIGSDVGGSIRMPAFFCGVFGHKPSHHLVPLTGHFPMDESNANAFSGKRYPLVTIGPITRSASDLLPLLKFMSGPDGFDPTIVPFNNECFERRRNWKDVRIFVCADPEVRWASRTSPELQQTVWKTAEAFKKLGAQVQELDRSIFRDAFEIWSACISEVEGPKFEEVMTDGKGAFLIGEFLRFLFRRSKYTAPALFFCLGERCLTPKRKRTDLLEKAQKLRSQVSNLLQNNGLILTPTHPSVAKKHYWPILRPFDFAITGIFAALQLPATAAPVERNKDGLPLGVQIIANEFQDDLSILAAMKIEEIFEPRWEVPL